MYHGYENLNGPEAVGSRNFVSDSKKTDHYFFLASKYKGWLMNSREGLVELFYDVDLEIFARQLPLIFQRQDDYSITAESVLAYSARTLGGDLDDHAERKAYTWALENVDEAHANRKTPGYEHPVELLPW